MMNDRADLLDRCLRLEARLLGVVVDPPVARPNPSPPQRGARRVYRKVTPADIVQMRDLRARGLSYYAIAQRVAFAESTARIYTRDVQVPS